MAVDIQFIGATGTVTGSKYLLSYNGKKILIDCGLFQGLKSLRLKNWDGFPVNASEIDCIVLTHAHIDHSGYIPRLIKKGFKGKVYSTAATKDICKLLLLDCGYLQEEEAEYLNRIGRTKHKPALPLFTLKDAEESLEYFIGVPFNETKSLGSDISFEFKYAGHILGAASIIFNINNKKIAFTGDVGRMDDLILYPPNNLPQIDYLVTESTYGNRRHQQINNLELLEKIVNDTFNRKGTIIVPAFAVGRAQTVMHYLAILKKQNRIPNMPMYLNSPMATDFSAIFLKYKELHKLSEAECRDITNAFRFVHSVEESKALNEKSGPMLIISASGMLTGGRVLHHLKAFASEKKNTILLTGFQSAGTRGDSLQRGAEEIKIHGEYIKVNAEVKILDNMSAHADYQELIQWFTQAKINPKKVFITHGEPSAADELRRRLTEVFDWDCMVPEPSQVVNLFT